MSARETALVEALGAMIAFLDVVLRGCGHASTLLCDDCTRHGRRALAAARRAMVHGIGTTKAGGKSCPAKR
jgi:hypothetical protein